MEGRSRESHTLVRKMMTRMKMIIKVMMMSRESHTLVRRML